jgi:hypothetical protein
MTTPPSFATELVTQVGKNGQGAAPGAHHYEAFGSTRQD